MEYTLGTVLTEDDFTIDPRVCNINELVENAKLMHLNSGCCDGISCYKCFLNSPISDDICSKVNGYDTRCMEQIQEEYARQFIRIFDKPKQAPHHIDFMENG